MSENTPKRPDEERVATGDRHDEVHFESDADQLVKASHLAPPDGPVPPQMHTASQERGEMPDDPAMLDVLVAPDEPSVWDARPADAPTERDGSLPPT